MGTVEPPVSSAAQQEGFNYGVLSNPSHVRSRRRKLILFELGILLIIL